MDRNEKVKFTEEGYQEVLKNIVITSKREAAASQGNISSFLNEGVNDEKEAILREVAANLIM